MKVEIILSIVVASCTIIYTVINYFTLLENVRNRKQKITPLIILFLKSNETHSVLVLHIKNIGEGLAKNVKIKTIKDYNQFGKNNMPVSDIGIFKNGLNIFPPNYELKFYVNSLTEFDLKDHESYIEFEVSYERIDNKKMKNHYALYFNQIIGQNYSNPPGSYIGQIPYYLKQISNNIKKNGG